MILIIPLAETSAKNHTRDQIIIFLHLLIFSSFHQLATITMDQNAIDQIASKAINVAIFSTKNTTKFLNHEVTLKSHVGDCKTVVFSDSKQASKEVLKSHHTLQFQKA